MNLKLIISDAFFFFRSHLVQISTLCLPWLLAVAFVDVLITATSDPSQGMGPLYLLAWMFNLLIYPIYTAALILLMAKRAQLEQPENKALVASAIKIWQPFFVVHIIGAGLTAVGLMFLVLPGIYVAVRLSFAEFYLVLEGVKPLEAIQKSFQATQPFFFQILLLLVLFLTPLWMLNFFIADFLSNQEAGSFVNILVAAITAFLMLFVDVVLFRVYMSVKQERPT
jgi:hypothetical protein